MADTDIKQTEPATPDGAGHQGEAAPEHRPEASSAAPAGAADDQRPAGFLDYNEGKPTGEFHTPSPEEQASRRKRSIYIGLAIVAFVALIYAITVLKLSAS